MKVSHRPISFGASLLLAAALLGGAHARAGTLYQTGFEPPTFSAGQPVDNQDVWVATASPLQVLASRRRDIMPVDVALTEADNTHHDAVGRT